MAIVKNGDCRVSSLHGAAAAGFGASTGGGPGSVSAEEDDGGGDSSPSPSTSAASSEKTNDGGDAVASDVVDSGMESDEFDLSELGEPGTLLCQVGNQTCSIPLELYDLPDLGGVLSLDTWNECLTEDERFALAEYLPDFEEQESFSRTLKELFTGKNFHFGNPLATLFSQLKGGLCDPRIVLYGRGLNFLKRREHYHYLRRYQNSMVGRLVRIKDAWKNCPGYGIDERLRLLNILKSQKPIGYGNDVRNAKFATDSESAGSDDRLYSRHKKIKINDRQGASIDVRTYGSGVRSTELARFGKENPKGVLKIAAPKLAQKEYAGISGRASSKHHVGLNTRAAVPLGEFPQHGLVSGWGKGASQRGRKHVGDDGNDIDGSGYGVQLQRSMKMVPLARTGLLKAGKKQELLDRYDQSMYVAEDPEGYSDDQGKRSTDRTVTIASYSNEKSSSKKKTKISRRASMLPAREQINISNGTQPLWQSKVQEEVVSLNHLVKFNDRTNKSKKLKASSKHRSGFGMNSEPYNSPPTNIQESYLHMDSRFMTPQGKSRNASVSYDGMNYSRAPTMIDQSRETESDSSEQVEEDGEITPPDRKLNHHNADFDEHQYGGFRLTNKAKRSTKLGKVDRKGSDFPDGGELVHVPETELVTVKMKKKGKANKNVHAPDQFIKKSLVTQPNEKLQLSSGKTNAEKKRKAMSDLDHSPQQPLFTNDYGSGTLDGYFENVDGASKSEDKKVQAKKLGGRMEFSDSQAIDSSPQEMPSMPLLGCNSLTKKPKWKLEEKSPDELDESIHILPSLMHQMEEATVTKKKGKRKSDAATESVTVVTPEPIIPEQETELEPEAMPEKRPFVLITPTIHTGFSFSIVHLLTAVRKAMITLTTEDITLSGSQLKNDDSGSRQSIRENQVHQDTGDAMLSSSIENMDMNTLEHARPSDLPCLTVQDIVLRVRSNPGDPCILETQEPLHDLIRGVLKIFSSKTAPLGAKGWKPLVVYEKSNKSWLWMGPVSSDSSDDNEAAEENSPEAWGIPHKMLVKLVDAFANWLKSGQETLQQIGCLPAPPACLLSSLDEKERFKDLRAQKSLITISPSSDEVRTYFRREELLRYLVPDRAFSYTAADGKKSIVAPLRRGGGKPTSKARDHFMLKPDRPPHVTILCLVRDAAARLPGSIGTRADVCTLIRDSQYIVENVSDAQVNQVVSGALDRLHYERDPCVQFDSDRKLWVYLHRDREEEDFEDDGTSSTKKWKRPKKDPTDQSDGGIANDVGYNAAEDDPTIGGSAAGFGYDQDLNFDASSIRDEEKGGLIYDDMRPNTENISTLIDSTAANMTRGGSANWDVLGLNRLQENNMMCQENSTSENFDDEAFSQDRTVELLKTRLL